jgi:hypothetical protein
VSTKNNPSKISDCYANAANDEPMFVLLGRDKHAPQLVEMWAGQRAAEGEDPAKVEEALKCAKAMRRYRYERRGAPSCEYCEASGGESGCLGTSTELVCEDGFLWWYSCNGPDTFLATNRNDETVHRTIEEYFATNEIDNEYCKNEALRVYHETRAMRARANEAVMGEEAEPTQPTVDEIVRLIKRDCPFWAPEVRVHKLLPYLQLHGDPLYYALKLLSDDERNGCGIDEVVVTKNVPKREVIVLGRDIEGTDIVSVEVNGKSVWVGPHNLAKEVETTEELPDYGGGISGG